MPESPANEWQEACLQGVTRTPARTKNGGSREAATHRTRFIELAGEINVGMPYHVISSVAGALNRQKKALNGAKVLILGVAYKRDIDDLRESPALTIIELLQKRARKSATTTPIFR